MTGYLFTSGNFWQAFKIGSILAFFKSSLLFKIFPNENPDCRTFLQSCMYYCQNLAETAIQRFIWEMFGKALIQKATSIFCYLKPPLQEVHRTKGINRNSFKKYST